MDRAGRLLRIVEHVGAAARSAREWKPALGTLVELLRGEHALIVSHGKNSGDTIVAEYSGLDENQFRRFQSPQVVQWMQPYLQALPNGKAITWAQIQADRDFERTPLWNEVVRPLNGYYAAAARYQSATTISFVTVCRPKRAGNFRAADTAALQALLPHFTASLDLHRQLRAANLRSAHLAAVLDSLPDGLIVTDGVGRPLFLNAAANRMIASERDGLFIACGRLRAADGETTQRVHDAISAVARGTARESQISLERPLSRTRLHLSLLPAFPLSVDAVLPPAAQVVIFIEERRPHAVIDAGAIADIFQLTRRESETAALLATGLRIEEIAARLGVGYNTVRSHLARVFEKTGTHSQVELVAAVRNRTGKDGS